MKLGRALNSSPEKVTPLLSIPLASATLDSHLLFCICWLILRAATWLFRTCLITIGRLL